jgi:hypothetical protein
VLPKTWQIFMFADANWFLLLIAIDLTDYSLLPNGLVSMLNYFSLSGEDFIFPCFSGQICFLLLLGSITKEFSTLLSAKHEYLTRKRGHWVKS